MSVPHQAIPKQSDIDNILKSNKIMSCDCDAAQSPLWIIKKSSTGGRGLFGRKKIEKGSLIFTNKPLAIGPRNCDLDTAFCAYCYKTCEDCNYCEKCGLVVCSVNCETSRMHQTDCKFITMHWKLKSNVKEMSKILGRIRIYIQLYLLPAQQKESLLLFQHDNTSMFHELEYLCSCFVIPDEQIEFMKTVYSILKINSFRIPASDREKSIPLRGLFPLAAFLNHNCVPNTRNVFKEDNSMEVYASRDIEFGEEIFTCYTNFLWCTPVRRYQLYKSKNFWCKCVRCKDPYEMGTNLSAIKCFNKQCTGSILPENPINPSSEWFCDSCTSKIPFENINSVQHIIGSLVSVLSEDDDINPNGIVLQRLESFLPSCSHIFVDLHLRWTLKLGYFEGMSLYELSEYRLALKEQLCRDTLRMAAALGAGDAHLRGLLLYHLHAALAERARRCPDQYDVSISYT
ncbi:PREDICTED: protein msta, isoform A-like isoform X1 [Papilio xuthus]|uniref:Protein msta, isoform A-like isoform X1 n=1 Tax=Papilio xuthus TaxID=66420 RepID=A0AAJ6ZAS3_PAPXU|nr:PREDICTED: protein msta, isoform A-like isoform X1 [Papilio xuthus]